MIREELRQLRRSINTVPRAERDAYGIIVLMILLTVGGAINLTPISTGFKTTLFVVVIAGIVFISFCIYRHQLHQSTESEDKPEHDARENTTVSKIIPPPPAMPPTIGVNTSESAEDSMEYVLKEIRNRLNDDALERKRAEEKAKSDNEAKAKLLADETVYYDERPGLVYFFIRGFWKVLIAWCIVILLVPLILSAVNLSSGQPFALIILIILAIATWYTVRCYGEWAWTRRRQEGNFVVVQQASNGWFGLYGRLYKISLLDCGNVVIGKSWYERILRLSSGSVSIETPLDNKRTGGSEAELHDVFKQMRNMRDPERFQSLVLKRHDELTFGQPDVLRRSDK